MKYFDIPTIKGAIERLQSFPANWLLPAFVFAANDIGTGGLVDMSKNAGTDQFLDRYFHGRRVGLSPMKRGNNLLRPRFSDITWKRGPFADDYMIQQDTKMWGNLFSSRGYREMRLEGYIDGEKAIAGLTNTFQAKFEEEVSEQFRFEDFLVWLFAFEGFPDEINSWAELLDHLVKSELKLAQFQPPYQGRFKVSVPAVPWPVTIAARPTNEEFLKALAPKLVAFLAAGEAAEAEEVKEEEEFDLPELGPDDPILVAVNAALQAQESLAFLLAGPPGTGKSRYARQLAFSLADGQSSRMLFLQFHPAIGYDDFIEGFRPIQSDDDKGVRYDLKPRLFMSFANKAAADPERIYVAVIDELNRGDVARIFGEVLTYLEPNYRDKEFTLPFSGKSAVLPKNLVMIATANPYDRSVTDLDDALLRRFWVIELDPDAVVLRTHLLNQGVDPGVINRTVQLFSIVNQAMPHGFGHTNFLRVRSIEDLAAVWSGRVRMGLRRAFLHDKVTRERITGEAQALLATREDDDANEEAAPAPGA